MPYNLNRAALKADARAAMAESRANPYITALVFVLVSYLLDYLSMRLLNYDDISGYLYAYAMGAELDQETLLYVYRRLMEPNFVGRLIDLLISVVQIMLSVGFTLFCLRTVRRLENSVGNLLDSFGMFFRILGLSIMTSIFVTLWSLLFVVPGIVASYRYRQAYYILLEHPELGVMECIRRSKELMYGRKMELFVLDLSFIGWVLLTAIPFVSVYVLPYTETTYAGYYVAISSLDAGEGRQRTR